MARVVLTGAVVLQVDHRILSRPLPFRFGPRAMPTEPTTARPQGAKERRRGDGFAGFGIEVHGVAAGGSLPVKRRRGSACRAEPLASPLDETSPHGWSVQQSAAALRRAPPDPIQGS